MRGIYIPAAGAAPAPAAPPAAAAEGAATAPPAGTEANFERPAEKENNFYPFSIHSILYSLALFNLQLLPEFMTSLMSFPFSSLMT